MVARSIDLAPFRRRLEFVPIFVGLVLLLGLALLTGVIPRAARLAAIVSFGAFAVYNVYQISTSEGSCGCFGKISIDPIYTFWLDVAVVLALGFWDPGFGPTLVGLVSSRTASTLAVFLIAGTGAALVMAGTVTSTLDKQGRLSGSGRWVIVDPGRGSGCLY
jgi:hypothetical protein